MRITILYAVNHSTSSLFLIPALIFSHGLDAGRWQIRCNGVEGSLTSITWWPRCGRCLDGNIELITCRLARQYWCLGGKVALPMSMPGLDDELDKVDAWMCRWTRYYRCLEVVMAKIMRVPRLDAFQDIHLDPRS